jgi:hypothetical protein
MMQIKKKEEMKINRTVLINAMVCIILPLILFLIISSDFALAGQKNKNTVEKRPEGFVLKKVDSHYEPAEDIKSVMLPDTTIKAGVFTYIDSDDFETGRIGFLIGNNKFFFVQGRDCACNPVTFAVYKNYLLIDGGALGSAGGHSTHMCLFKYDKNSVKLLDTIGSHYDLRASYPGMNTGVKRKGPPSIRESMNTKLWILKDPKELKVKFTNGLPSCTSNPTKECWDFFYSDGDIELYIKISEDRLHIDYNPELYEPIFEKLQNKYQGKDKSCLYYVYGYLAGKMDLKKVKELLAKSEFRSGVVEFLQRQDIKKWDSKLRDNIDTFKIIQYKLDKQVTAPY